MPVVIAPAAEKASMAAMVASELRSLSTSAAGSHVPAGLIERRRSVSSLIPAIGNPSSPLIMADISDT